MIYLDKPLITEDDVHAVAKAVREGEISTRSKLVDELEEYFSKRYRCAGVVATNSGTAALYLVFQRLSPWFKNIVKVSALSFVALPNAARLAGYKLSIQDVEAGNWLVSLNNLTTVPVNLFGNTLNQGETFLTDAAESLGSEYSSYTCRGFIMFNGNKTI